MNWKVVDEPVVTTPATVPTKPEDPKVKGVSGWDSIIIVNLIIVGLLLLGSLFQGPADPDGPTGLPDDPGLVRLVGWIDVVIGLTLFAAMPVAWLLATRAEPLEGTLRYLKIKTDSPRRWPFWLGIGCLGAVGFYILVTLFGLLLYALDVNPGGDPLFGELVSAGGWPLIVGISIGAGVGEEILFRGILQKWMGWIGQAALFAAVHVNQGFLAVGFIFLIALAFGYLVKRGVPLWSVMIMHTFYDIILLGQLYVSL